MEFIHIPETQEMTKEQLIEEYTNRLNDGYVDPEVFYKLTQVSTLEETIQYIVAIHENDLTDTLSALSVSAMVGDNPELFQSIVIGLAQAGVLFEQPGIMFFRIGLLAFRDSINFESLPLAEIAGPIAQRLNELKSRFESLSIEERLEYSELCSIATEIVIQFAKRSENPISESPTEIQELAKFSYLITIMDNAIDFIDSLEIIGEFIINLLATKSRLGDQLRFHNNSIYYKLLEFVESELCPPELKVEVLKSLIKSGLITMFDGFNNEFITDFTRLVIETGDIGLIARYFANLNRISLYPTIADQQIITMHRNDLVQIISAIIDESSSNISVDHRLQSISRLSMLLRFGEQDTEGVEQVLETIEEQTKEVAEAISAQDQAIANHENVEDIEPVSIRIETISRAILDFFVRLYSNGFDDELFDLFNNLVQTLSQIEEDEMSQRILILAAFEFVLKEQRDPNLIIQLFKMAVTFFPKLLSKNSRIVDEVLDMFGNDVPAEIMELIKDSTSVIGFKHFDKFI